MSSTIRRYPNLPGAPPSVTSILKAVWPTPALDTWMQNRAAELAREFPNESVKNILNRHPGESMARGTRVHLAIQMHLTGLPLPDLNVAESAMFEQWEGWWEGAEMYPLAVEQTVWNNQYPYAGTLDLLATRGDARVVVDWKTCTRLPADPYLDHCVQLAAYAAAELVAADGTVEFSDDVDCGMVVYIATDGIAQFTVSGRDWKQASDGWKAALAMARVISPEFFIPQLGLVEA